MADSMMDDEDRAEWLDIDGWACTPGCPDDMCRSMGTCAWPPAPAPQLIIRPGLSLTDDQVADLRERFEVAMKNPEPPPVPDGQGSLFDGMEAV